MPPPIGQCVAVITGASSGIGRATALAFAQRGATVALAARDRITLDEAARECISAGGTVLAVPTDVTDQAAVSSLAGQARDRFGRIDVWINAAAVIAYGKFEKTPAEVYRQVIETNLFGQIHGARAVLPYFREQDGGVLINLCSVWGSVSSPYVGSYVVSKYGVRAFSESLQEALWLERQTRKIHVCTILPQCVDTPIFRHAANYTGRAAKSVPPVLGPDRVVRAILRSVEHPRRQRSVGNFARVLELGHAVVPGLFNRLVPTVMTLTALGRDQVEAGAGNVFEPMPEWNRVTGGWRRPELRATAAGGGALATAATAFIVRRQRRRT